ncbi:MAG: response regulator transcription factor [Bacteroidales bacterium]|nr:response regulator transcription factor [Bacteroidales bacterium]
MRILIVEDEKDLANEIRDFLVGEQYNCDMAHTGHEASEMIAINPYDFILLDLGLPDYLGLDLLQEVKKYNPESYIIIITARNELEDKIKGLNSGADDYLAKPFSILELLSRIQAISRRKFGYKTSVIQFGDFNLDTIKKTLQYNNQIIELTAKEFKLLNYLVLNKNRVLDRMQLMEHVWGDFFEEDYDSNYIDVHIKNIRKKLLAYDPKQWIKTLRGVGYKFELTD